MPLPSQNYWLIRGGKEHPVKTPDRSTWSDTIDCELFDRGTRELRDIMHGEAVVIPYKEKEMKELK